MVELARGDENLQEDGDIDVSKTYNLNSIRVIINHHSHGQIIHFANEKQMRRAGQCLIDLARIGGSEVEIKDQKD